MNTSAPISHQTNCATHGFTLIEILVTITILFVLFTITFTSFANLLRHEAIQRDTATLHTLLETARSRTLASDNAQQYGVYFNTDQSQAELFRGSSYTPSSVELIHTLHGTVIFDTINLAHSSSSVVFYRLTGSTDNSGTVSLINTAETASTTLQIQETGIIERI